MALRYRRCIYNGKLHWEDTELADHTWKYEILVRARSVEYNITSYLAVAIQPFFKVVYI